MVQKVRDGHVDHGIVIVSQKQFTEKFFIGVGFTAVGCHHTFSQFVVRNMYFFIIQICAFTLLAIIKRISAGVVNNT